MNILMRELRQGLRVFGIWAAGLAFLMLGGPVKFDGMSAAGAGSMNALLERMPRALLALFGMGDGNIETLGGFYAVLSFYAALVVACYAISLGTAAVGRELQDKTCDFLFTRPRSRAQILAMKLLGGLILLTALCLLNLVFSLAAPPLYGMENTVVQPMLLFCLGVYLTGLLFFALGALLTVLLPRAEQAAQLSWAALLLVYGLCVASDMDERLGFLRPLNVLRCFGTREVLEGQPHPGYAIALAVVSGGMLTAAFLCFRRKDLNAQ